MPTDSRFTHASDLVAYIRATPEYASYFCVGVAGEHHLDVTWTTTDHHICPRCLKGYPDGHTGGAGEDEEIRYLKAKVDAGADFIMTQLFYDVDGFVRWLKKVRSAGS